MKQIILYAMIFMAVVLPTLFFTVLSDDKRKKKVKEEKSLPPLLQFSRPPAVFFELLGFGTLFRKLFPEHTRSVQQKLDFAGLRISPGTFYCMQMFLFIFSALLAAGITGMSVDEENRISIPIAGLPFLCQIPDEYARQTSTHECGDQSRNGNGNPVFCIN